jgi:hypothetical protein
MAHGTIITQEKTLLATISAHCGSMCMKVILKTMPNSYGIKPLEALNAGISVLKKSKVIKCCEVETAVQWIVDSGTQGKKECADLFRQMR